MRAHRRGANAVEFGLGLVVLVVLVGGILDWGWFLHNEQHVIEAAREGARAAASTPLDDDPEAMAEWRAAEVLEERGLADAEILVARLSLAEEEAVAVDVVVPFRPLARIVPVPEELRGSMTMRLEEQP